MPLRSPTFLGIGGQKCASTWLSESLRRHPQVFISSPKELRYFVDNQHQSLDWYLNHFKGAAAARHCGEFSSNYIYYPEITARIKKDLGVIKIIAIVREPMSRTLSHLKHLIRDERLPAHSGRIDAEAFDAMVKKEPTLLSHSRYAAGLQAFVGEFGRDNVLVLDQGDCLQNGVAVEQCVWRFLGVDSTVESPNAERLVSHGIIPNHFWLERLRQLLYKQLKRRAPQLINVVRRSGLSNIYRHWNEGQEISFSDCALDYIAHHLGDDWSNTQKYLTFSDRWGRE